MSILVHGVAFAQDETEQLTPNARFMSGKLYLKQQVYDKAESQLRLAVAGDTASAEYRAYWATALAYLGEEKLQKTSGISDLNERLAAIRATSDVFKAAGEQFALAIAMDPKKQTDWSGDNRAHFWVDIYKQADGLFRESRYEDALELYKILTVLNPEEPEGFFRVAYTMDRLGEAKQSVIKAGESKVMALDRIGQLGDCGQFKSSKAKSECRKKIRELEKIVTNVDSFTRSKYADLGYNALDAAQAEKDPVAKRPSLDEAQMFFEKALEQDPSLEGVRFSYGNVFFNRARTFDGESPDTSRAYPQYRKAAAIFASLANADSVDADTRRDALYNAGSALYAASDWQGALPLLKRYIDLDVKDGDTYRRVAKCMSEMGQHADAVAYYLLSLSLEADKKDITEAMNTARNLHAGSDQVRAADELGNPEEIRAVEEDNRTTLTYIWWLKGEARHFRDGALVGAVKFAPMTVN